jgi:uncharacterized OB-fold protein
VTEAEWRRPAAQKSSFTTPFWEATRERRLVMQYCTVARKFQHYPRPVSIYSGRKTVEWRAVTGRGFIYACTVTRRGPPAFRGREPYIVATIELDEGVRLMSNVLVDGPTPEISIGARVTLDWSPMDDGFNFPVFGLAP